MKFLNLIIATFLSGILFSSPALADACSNAARSLANGDPNATLLSVKTVKGNNGKVRCEARIKITSSNKPPRIVVKKFNP